MSDNYSAWNIDFEDFFKLSSFREKLEFLVRFAVLAPSSHNSQPWKFKISENAIDIVPDPARAVPVSDPQNRHLAIALGCAAENLMVAAGYYGLAPSLAVQDDAPGTPALRIDFSQAAAERTTLDLAHLAPAILTRRVNRNPFEIKLPDQKFLAEIPTFAYPGTAIDVIADVRRGEISDLFMQSRMRAFSSAPFRAEMADYKRNNWTRSFWGMPGATMGFSTLASFFAPFVIRHVNVMKFIQKSEEDLLKNKSPLFIFVSSAQSDQKAWVTSGRTLERLLLEAEASGIQASLGAIPPQYERLQKIIGTALRPQMFVRLGYTPNLPPHSPRLPAQEVVQSA